MPPPSHVGSTNNPGFFHEPSGYTIHPVMYNRITAPSKKVWLLDYPLSYQANLTINRWKPATEYANNLAHQGFTRHQNGGNVLFYDGHVEWLSIDTFIHPTNGDTEKTVRYYFNPYRAPELDY